MKRVLVVLIIGILCVSAFSIFTPHVKAVAPPVISSVSAITATRLQTIHIYGSGFGNTWPQTVSLGDGSVDTLSSATPYMCVSDNGKYQRTGDPSDGGDNWAAGIISPSCYAMVGIILLSWSDNEIVLGGFGTALGVGQGTWYIANGDPITVTVVTSSGQAAYTVIVAIPPLTYSVFFEGSGVGNPAQVWSATLDGYGTEYSNGPGNTIHIIIFTGVANGGPYSFIVTPPSGFVAQPTSGTITVNGGDAHQPTTFNPVPVTYTFTLTAGSGGSVSYSFSLGSGTVSSGQPQQLTVPQSCQISMTANPDSLHVFQTWSTTGPVSVSDPSSASTTATVNGNGGVTANFAYNLRVSISPTSKLIQIGESVAFTATASGGSDGYTYVWYWMQYGTTPPNDGSQSTGTSNMYTFTPSSAGGYGVYVIVTDSGGNTAQSLASSVTARAEILLGASLSFSSIILDWQPPTNPPSPVLEYYIFRGTSEGGEGVYPDYIAQVNGDVKTYEDKSVTTGIVYYYYVQVGYANGPGEQSNEVKCASFESVKGVMSRIELTKVGDVPQCFSIQQNIEIPVRGTLANGVLTLSEYYWVQNIVYVFGQETWKMASSMQIWHMKVSETDPAKFEYQHLDDCRGKSPVGNCIPVGGQYDSTVLLKTWIDGNTLKMTNNFINDFEYTFPINAFADLPCSKEPFLGVLGKSPEIVLVGTGEGHDLKIPMYPNAAFNGPMEGLEKSCFVIGSDTIAAQNWWVPTKADPPMTTTKETSNGLAWDMATGRFHYDPFSSGEGFWFRPDFIGSPPNFPNQATPKLKSVVVSLQCPANLSVIDDQGNFAGFNQTSGQIQSEIPFAFFLDEKTLWILDPNETYTVVVTGRGSGNFTLLISMTDENGQASMLWNKTETITQNESLSWSLTPTSQEEYIVTSNNPFAVQISPLSASLLVGQSVTFTSTVQGETPPYTYQWYLNGNPVSGATSVSWIFTPSASGIYYVYAKVTDTSSSTTQSETARIIAAAVPVGGYSVLIQVPTRTEPILPYIALIATLTAVFTKLKPKTKRKR
jgi:hypothetical protein